MMLIKLDLVTPISLQRWKLRLREATVEELSGSRTGPLSYPLVNGKYQGDIEMWEMSFETTLKW